MKTRFLLIGLLGCLSLCFSTNLNAQTVLLLNGSATGVISGSNDTTLYSLTTNADGAINLTLTVSNNTATYAALYDSDGVTLLVRNYTYTGPITVSQDGLAQGKYYVKIYPYYTSSSPNFTISNTLTVPAEANDHEPNNLPHQAQTLTLNDSIKGHVGYYYNIHRDTADWYKVTANADGLLRLRLKVANNTAVWCTLYDNDGTTVLTSQYTYTNVDVNTDGLAAGTYYVKLYCYYDGQFAPYTLSDSLFTYNPNDPEPNNSRAQAETLPLNDSTTGHVGYYYDIHRDTADWYKVTTNADGLLSLRLKVANNTAVYCTLYDNDGTTILANQYTYTNIDINTDGLAAGTYYCRVSCYNSGQFAPYTLADSLFTYNANDPEPNMYPYQATTLPANGSVNGHVGFYYNNKRDTLDFWKINYTGSGNLNFTFKLIPHNGDGSISPVWFQVYNDTTKALFYYNYYSAASSNISFTGLPQGYYYIRIVPYNYNSQFNAYSITNSFTQVNVAAISLLKSASHNACGSDSLIYGLSGSHSPYTVRLYRNGALYDSLTTASDSAVFRGLNDGNYYTTVFGDGATGDAFGKSAVTQFLPPTPAGLSNTKISTTSAQLNWNDIGCIKNYQIQYMITGGSTWTTINTNSNNSYNLNGLNMDTTYSWRIASVDTVNSVALESFYSDTIQFTTPADTAKIAFVSANTVNDCSNTSKLQYQISHSESPYSVQLYRFGVVYGTPIIVNDNNPFKISNLPAGIYYTTVFGDNVPGALGTSSTSTILPPISTGLNATNVMSHSATLNWSMLSCTNYDTLEYRANDTATWKILITKDNSGVYDLTNLAGNVSYLFKVSSVVVVNGQKLSSGFSSTFTFTTLVALPVTLVNFSATAHNDLIRLNWSTASEINNKGFEIFRSVDGTNFTSIGFVASAGNSDQVLNYQFTDKPDLSGNVFYRLKQVDLDGNFVWSNIVHVTINGNQLITFMPNPAKSFITIFSPLNVKEVRLLATSGQIIKVWQNVSPNAQLDLGSIASGTYLIEFLNDQSSQTMKLVKSN